MDDQDSFFEDHHQLMDCGDENYFGDELEEFYKPFYPVQSTVVEFKEEKVENVILHDHQIDDQPSGKSCVLGGSSPAAYSPKYKRRKNQHKRVVIKVSLEGLASDMWAWRKYGQKPIKGSPYPRSYYRCSSSKGCLARKQVEQSCTDIIPGMFIVTYTAEHNHSQPTKRNSLAGTIRQKFPPLKTQNESSSCIIISSDSPKSLLQVQEVDFPLPREIIKQEKKDNEEIMDFIFNDDFNFFSGLEEFDDFVNSEVCHNAAAQQFPAVRSSCS
ncbi:hypothetical protein RD792_017840 [Penstemon davidsonii]|uniref:WRKY domain-containing protein n=1 Tax=Penstemon davidsonii TaxID=160366 RepID=A0ABR0DVN4_9LAMI|nr:hypothetical protein RD792_017840 [Penstemon davidsonii]